MKFYGHIGFSTEAETAPGVWKKTIIEREYRGNLLRIYKTTENDSAINDGVNFNNIISILADPYANENIINMVYVTYMGQKWKIKSVDASKYPRLNITVGGVYNG